MYMLTQLNPNQRNYNANADIYTGEVGKESSGVGGGWGVGQKMKQKCEMRHLQIKIHIATSAQKRLK